MDLSVHISLALVESLIDQRSEICSVLLLELKHSIEVFLQNGLIRGCPVSLADAFNCAWRELVIEEPESMSLSDNEI